MEVLMWVVGMLSAYVFEIWIGLLATTVDVLITIILVLSIHQNLVLLFEWIVLSNYDSRDRLSFRTLDQKDLVKIGICLGGLFYLIGFSYSMVALFVFLLIKAFKYQLVIDWEKKSTLYPDQLIGKPPQRNCRVFKKRA